MLEARLCPALKNLLCYWLVGDRGLIFNKLKLAKKIDLGRGGVSPYLGLFSYCFSIMFPKII